MIKRILCSLLCLCLLFGCSRGGRNENRFDKEGTESPLSAYDVLRVPDIPGIAEVCGLTSGEPAYISDGSMLLVARADESGVYAPGSYVIIRLDAATGEVLHTLSGELTSPARSIRESEGRYMVFGDNEALLLTPKLEVAAKAVIPECAIGDFTYDISYDFAKMLVFTTEIVYITNARTGEELYNWPTGVKYEGVYYFAKGSPRFIDGNPWKPAVGSWENDDPLNQGNGSFGCLIKNPEDGSQLFVRRNYTEVESLLYTPSGRTFCYIGSALESPEETLTIITTSIPGGLRGTFPFRLDPFDGENRSPSLLLRLDSGNSFIYSESGEKAALSYLKAGDPEALTMAIFENAEDFEVCLSCTEESILISASENGAPVLYIVK